MAKYTIPVTEKFVTVYEVEARSGNEAAMKVGMLLESGHDRSDVRTVSKAMVQRTVAASARVKPGEDEQLTVPGTV